jgi:CheY-like chemotaxis protein
MQTILLAEDSEGDARLLERSLKKAGVLNPVITVSDGDETIRYLSGQGEYADRRKFPFPAVLLLDLKMCRVGGFEVLKWWQTRPDLKNLVVVVLSGQQELYEDVTRAYQMGAHTFLFKPFMEEQVFNLVRAFAVFHLSPPTG